MNLFGLPKSAKKILLVLSSSSSISQTEIKKRTGLSTRSVKGSLALLKKKNIVKECSVFEDMRRKKYSLRGYSVIRQHKTLSECERLQTHGALIPDDRKIPLVLGSNPNNPTTHGGKSK